MYFPCTTRPKASGRVRIADTFLLVAMFPAILVGNFERLFKFLYACQDLRVGLRCISVCVGFLSQLTKSAQCWGSVLLVMATLRSVLHGVHAPMLFA